MPGKAEYRSSLRSKKLIRKAFIELLQTQSSEKITVTDIVEKAEVNRGTFYAHYTDISMLIQSIENEIVDELCKLLSDVDNIDLLREPLPIFLKISEYLEQNQELITAMMGSRTTSPFFILLPDLIARQLTFLDEIDNDVQKGPSFEERCRFYAGGATSMYMAWLRGDVSGSLKDVAYKLSEIIMRMNP